MKKADALYASMVAEITSPPDYDPAVHGLLVSDLADKAGVSVCCASARAREKLNAGEWEQVTVTIRRGNGTRGRATAYRPAKKGGRK